MLVNGSMRVARSNTDTVPITEAPLVIPIGRSDNHSRETWNSPDENPSKSSLNFPVIPFKNELAHEPTNAPLAMNAIVDAVIRLVGWLIIEK